MDLNLIRTFVAVYDARSVSAAATDLHLTQPSVTHALNRLRKIVADDLFVKVPRGVQPTVTAQRLYPEFVTALNLVTSAITHHHTFDPTRTHTPFRLALSEAGETSVLPQLVRALREHAPDVRLQVTALDVDRVEEELFTGQLDAFISSAPFTSARVESTPLFTEPYVVLHCREHPLPSGTEQLTEQLRKRPHIAVDGPIGHHRPVDVMARENLPVTLTVPRFTALPALIEHSAAVAIVPRYVADAFTTSGQVSYCNIPWQMERLQVKMHARHEY